MDIKSAEQTLVLLPEVKQMSFFLKPGATGSTGSGDTIITGAACVHCHTYQQQKNKSVKKSIFWGFGNLNDYTVM